MVMLLLQVPHLTQLVYNCTYGFTIPSYPIGCPYSTDRSISGLDYFNQRSTLSWALGLHQLPQNSFTVFGIPSSIFNTHQTPAIAWSFDLFIVLNFITISWLLEVYFELFGSEALPPTSGGYASIKPPTFGGSLLSSQPLVTLCKSTTLWPSTLYNSFVLRSRLWLLQASGFAWPPSDSLLLSHIASTDYLLWAYT